MGAEIERHGKRRLIGRQPLGQVVGHAREQKIMAGSARRHAVAPAHQQGAVEDIVVGRHAGDPSVSRARKPLGFI